MNPFGGYHVDCKGQPQQAQQSQQIPYQHKQEGGCRPQFVFEESRLPDFFVKVRCDERVVVVESQNRERQVTTLPIGPDGRVQGNMKYPQSVQSDTRGNQACWVEFIVTFSGKVDCRRDGSSDINLGTQFAFAPTTRSSLAVSVSAASEMPGESPDNHSPSPSPSPSGPEVSPSPTPSETGGSVELPGSVPHSYPSPYPSPSPHPSHSPNPHPTGTVTVTPIVTCIVEEPCPIIGETHASCPAKQE